MAARAGAGGFGLVDVYSVELGATAWFSEEVDVVAHDEDESGDDDWAGSSLIPSGRGGTRLILSTVTLRATG